MIKNGVRRGDVVYVCDKPHCKNPHPAVIVSNNLNNTFSPTITVVYLTTKPKKPLPTHVTVLCKVPSIAMCERIYTLSKSFSALHVFTLYATFLKLCPTIPYSQKTTFFSTLKWDNKNINFYNPGGNLCLKEK